MYLNIFFFSFHDIYGIWGGKERVVFQSSVTLSLILCLQKGIGSDPLCIHTGKLAVTWFFLTSRVFLQFLNYNQTVNAMNVCVHYIDNVEDVSGGSSNYIFNIYCINLPVQTSDIHIYIIYSKKGRMIAYMLEIILPSRYVTFK